MLHLHGEGEDDGSRRAGQLEQPDESLHSGAQAQDRNSEMRMASGV